ncbi:MAG: type II secretion system protein [Verrucomicrobia bacterium]|nr:type II secretion system protein [Verrucomicrobiota bacterium]
MKLWTRRTFWSGSTRSRSRAAGFTFAEVLAALVVMAIVIPVAMKGLQIASRAGVVAQRKSVASRLAESLLNEVIVTQQWEGALQRGDFGEDYNGYEWRILNETWSQEAALRMISVEVIYRVQDREYNVRLSTLATPITY